MKKSQKKQLTKIIITIIIFIFITLLGYFNPKAQSFVLELLGLENSNNNQNTNVVEVYSPEISFDLDSIPDYSDKPYVYINDNKPFFTKEEYTTKAFERYSSLDSLGRCGVAYANVCRELMPKAGEKRTSISHIYPSGWKNVPYDIITDGKYLYNRSHLIGWQLTAENDNELNLITGTRYMNAVGMLPFENMVDDYFEDDENLNNHVLYRVTPIFEDKNLVASGVEMEAYSVEDNGEGVCYNVYIYNVQPGIEINYLTGESKLK